MHVAVCSPARRGVGGGGLRAGARRGARRYGEHTGFIQEANEYR